MTDRQPKSPRVFRITLTDKEQRERLYAAASQRRLLPESLVQALIEHVLQDDLVNAVLDEDQQQQPQPSPSL